MAAHTNRILTLIVIFVHPIFCSGERISMKIVDEPSSYGLNNPYQGQNHIASQSNNLKLRISPANFSGPAHLHRLFGHCYSKTDDQYKYEFCPFANVTQHEQSLRWNPYSGVLGVWQEWAIENNTFIGLMMKEGDRCGAIYRSVKVYLKCGNKEELVSVSEPRTCSYEMVFKTPLVCHAHSLLVYPVLKPSLQDEWDKLEGLLQQEIVTRKGYEHRLHQIFEEAGFYLSSSHREELIEKTQVKQEHVQQEIGEFHSLTKCQEEYNKLKKEIEGLRTLLALDQVGRSPSSNTESTTEKTSTIVR